MEGIEKNREDKKMKPQKKEIGRKKKKIIKGY